MRGEYPRWGSQCWQKSGSPPLARGILLLLLFRYVNTRITPACAGNTRQKLAVKTWAEDHPRLRGEYQTAPRRHLRYQGSPPLARGILPNFRGQIPQAGITPACAGNTLKKSHIYSLFPISTSKFHLVSQTPEMS